MTDKTLGLTNEEVDQLTREGFVNVTVKNQSKTIGQIIFSNVFTYFNLVFAVFAALLILVRSYVNMTFLPIILCNTLIGIIQEIRSKRVLDRLTVLNAPMIHVIREGKKLEVLSETLVKGDLCEFGAGNQICADAIVVSGSVRVNEALVTGEADEIVKNEGDTLLSGSFIVSGRCHAELTKVGHESFAAKLTLEAKASRKKQQTQMMHSLDQMVKIIGILIIPLGILMYTIQRVFIHVAIKDSVVSVVASLVGMIPEGLYLLASVALVVSVMRLGKKRVLVHEMACVETLARVNVLCVDKTGTITQNCMSVEEVIPLKQFTEYEEEYPPLHEMIGKVVSYLDEDNATMKAIKQYFNETEDNTEDNTKDNPEDNTKNNTKNDTDSNIDNARAYNPEQIGGEPKLIRAYQFTSEVKYSAVVLEDGAYVLGAPEKLLLTDYDKYSNLCETKAAEGARVLIFGTYEGEMNGRPLTEPVTPLAMIVLNNPLRDEARDTFSYFQQQRVEIKVISGDHPVTVSNVVMKAGIEHADSYVDAGTLTTEEEVREAALRYTVFGRVKPEQKRQLIQALKDDGKTVAMTGDGVNDVLALKKADCSIAMASGSEAASNAAQIVLLDSDFACMPSVVLEGRRVVNNIQRAASLFLVKNIFSILFTFFTLVTFSIYPLFPTQLSLLGAFTIGTPAFFLALQPNKSLIKGHFLTNVALKALPAGLTDFLVAAILLMIGRFYGYEIEQISTMIILCVVMVGLLTLLRVCLPLNWLRTAVCFCMTIGIIISIAVLPGLFAIYPLSQTQLMTTVITMACSVPAFYLICKIVQKQIERMASRSERFSKLLH